MRILLQKLYHSYDACFENVVLIRICYVLFSLRLCDIFGYIKIGKRISKAHKTMFTDKAMVLWYK